MNTSHQTPIFIHSLFRAGSTYLFNVFRRAKGYWCYQEPLNERLLQNVASPGGFLEGVQGLHEILRHPQMERPYGYEYHVVADVVEHQFKESFSYDMYFENHAERSVPVGSYLSGLISGAQGRPVLQCCRTSGRVTRLREEFDGIHLFLWRHPWDQWWSYKLNDYFDQRNLFILQANPLPALLLELRNSLGIPGFAPDKASIKSAYCLNRRLDADASYTIFYALWCHAMLEARASCDLSLSIDRLSSSGEYSDSISSELVGLGITGLDFSDCAVAMTAYGRDDAEFFVAAEVRVHQLLLTHGYSHEQVVGLQRLADERRAKLLNTKDAEYSAVRDGMRARQYARQLQSRLAETQAQLFEARAQLQRLSSQFRQTAKPPQHGSNS